MRSCFASVLLCGLVLGGCAVDPEELEDNDVETSEVAEATEAIGFECLPTCGIQGVSCGLQDDQCGGTLWCGSCACPATFRACQVTMPTIYEVPVTLTAGIPFEVWTSGLSTGADSVIHIVDAATGAQLAMNDNFGGTLASHLTYTSPVTRDAIVVVRARNGSTQGTATFNTFVGSLPITLGALEQFVQAPRTGDQFTSVRLPGDPGTMHVAYLMSGESISSRIVGGGIEGAVSFPLAATSATIRLILGQSNLSFTVGTSPPGMARIVRNDANINSWFITHDLDHDLLGYELEAALGTCPSLSGTATGPDGVAFSCATATDARDTDGDGLFDGWEVLGKRHTAGNLPLPKWGSNPRRKDIFLEEDFGKERPTDTPSLTPAATTRTMVQIYADRYATMSSAQRAAHAASIKNPDGSVGVALHVDSGVAPESPSEVTHYGNWGGHSVVPEVYDAMNQPKSMPAAQAYPTYMSAARVGVFRYWLGSMGGGGQQSDWTSYNASYIAASTAAHELGHLVMTGSHSGIPTSVDVDPYCKPNYPSLMNYAFGGAGFSGGDSAPSLNNAFLQETAVANPTTMRDFLLGAESSFGYKVDYAQGSVDWNRDGVFSPSTVRVRAYANNQPGSACQYTRYGGVTLQPQLTTVTPALSRFAGRVFVFYGGTTQLRYVVATSTLDCNTSTSTQPCATFTTSGTLALDTTGGVDAVHLTAPETTIVVGRGADGVLRSARITGISGETPQWSAVVPLVGPAAAGEPAVAVDIDGSALLVYRDAAGLVYQRTFNTGNGAWSSAAPVLGAAGAQIMMSTTKSSPGIGVANLPVTGLTPSPRMYAIFADAGNITRLFYRDPADGRFKPRSSDTFEMTGRPQIQWIPDPLDVTLGGRMIIASTTREWNGPEARNIWVMRSHVAPGAPGEIRVGLIHGYDSDWTSSYGIDLMFEAGVDTNLRAAWSYSLNWPEGWNVRQRVRFDPKADGINNYQYDPSSDWRVMRVKMCASFASANGVVCPPQDW